jgi:hypothetical protein
MSKIREHFVGAELRMRDAEVRLTAEAGGPPSVGSRIPIACTCDN